MNFKNTFAIGVIAVTNVSCTGVVETTAPQLSTVECAPSSVMSNFNDSASVTALVRYLAASGQWRVTKRGGALVAEYERRSGVAQVLPTDIVDRQVSVALRFEPYTLKGWRDTERDSITVTAGVSVAEVHLNRAEDASLTLGSDLSIASEVLFLRIREWSKSYDRALTAFALNQVANMLSMVKEKQSDILSTHSNDLLPAGSITNNSRDTIIVRESGQKGIYIVNGYANPKEWGFVKLKIRRLSDETVLSEDRVLRESTEYIGYSKDPSVRFFYQSEIQIDEGTRNVPYKARFELWFCPEQGEERKLTESVMTVIGWER